MGLHAYMCAHLHAYACAVVCARCSYGGWDGVGRVSAAASFGVQALSQCVVWNGACARLLPCANQHLHNHAAQIR